MSDSYSYERREGIRLISWSVFYGLCKGLALAVETYKPEIVVGVARGGAYPATQIAHMLQSELFITRLSRRVNGNVVYKKPEWIQRPTDYVENKRVLVVDEISDTGQTLQIVKGEIKKLGALQIRTAVLYAHKQSADTIDYAGIVSDELFLNPWDREIVENGEFKMHPEYTAALDHQTDTSAEMYKPDIATIKPERKI